MTTPFGAQSTWRQLVDLIGRGRVVASPAAIAKLKAIRAKVPPPVRAASARSLADARPPAALVRFFAGDELSIAAPVLRAAQIHSAAWIEMLPEMSPATRSILRHRRDLPPAVTRALESFGSVDFVLPNATVADVEAVTGAPDREPVVAPELVAEPEPIARPKAEREAAPVEELAAAAAIECAAGTTDAVEPEHYQPMSIDWRDVVGADELESPVAAEPEVEAQPEPGTTAREATPSTDAGGQEPNTVLETSIAEPVAQPTMSTAPSQSPFVSIASVALGLPVVAEALRHSAGDTPVERAETFVSDEPPAAGAVDHAAEKQVAATADEMTAPEVSAPIADDADEPVVEAKPEAAVTALPLPPPEASAGTFQIAELVARIDAYQRLRDDAPAFPLLANGPEVQPELFVLDPAPAQTFRFETDAAGVVRWIEGASRAPLIGLSLDLAALPSGSRVDGVAAGAFRRRASFANARLVVEGNSDAAGQWRINGIPVFDRASGRFTGYRGTARRPRADEMAEPARDTRNSASDALRQLVHELRTPANAISGFAEMIESQMLGPVPSAYRAHAAAIRGQASDLLGAIDDIDMAARIESDALDLRPGDVPLAPMLARIAEDLAPLARLRGTDLTVDPGADGMAIAGDDRAVERLIARLLATLVSSGGQDERIGVVATAEGDRTVALAFDRPQALGAYPEERLLTIDAEAEAERDGAPLLGTGFALRLARNLATELGGSLSIGDNALTLRLPAAFLPEVDQVSSS